MAIKYEAYTRLGEKVVGVLHTDDEEAVYDILDQEDLIPYRIRPAQSGFSLVRMFPTVFNPSAQDIIDFTRQLAALLSSGIPLVRCLTAQRGQVSNKGLKYALGEIVVSVEAGNKLSDALAEQSHIFPDFYVRMLRVGEATGGLPYVLNQVADTLQRRKVVTDRVRDAAVYPAFTLLVAVVAAIVLVTYSLPSLSSLLSEVGSDQPTSTRILISVSGFFGEYGAAILIGLAVLAVLIFVALRTEIGRAATDTVLLRVPVIGRVIVANNMFSLTSILSTLLKSGMSPVEGLKLTQRGMANAYYRRRLGRVIDRATEGTKLGEAFEEERGFPAIVSQAIVTGETRGRLDDTMFGLSEYYEDVTKRAAGGITELIQPAIILFVAGMVGFVAVAIISGIYSALGAVR
ncbi:MAG: type II secretion system F family protein [Dehalococcoidia bacterium]|nr:type II secretion system F family protein [Chloroflexota bacterium]MXY42639.1 type II secretion system F family protein [Dehalococcoidia bacterium]MYD51486.1 type II secretion system F family protein [Dehalococcoidia bacterium]